MTKESQTWTDNLDTMTVETLTPYLCQSFSSFPFMVYSGLVIKPNEHGVLECTTEMKPELVGNVVYNILHGGVTATMLDSIGGIHVMLEIFKKSTQAENVDYDQLKNTIGRVATTDLRIDYLSAGQGKRFIATAEVIRVGRRHSTVTMRLVNEKDKLIAIATANYAY